MLSNKQKMDLLMESLEAVGGNSESLNELSEYQTKSIEVRFDDRHSNDPRIAFAIKNLIDAVMHLTLSGDLDDDKRKFVQDKLKQYGINLEQLQNTLLQKVSKPQGQFNYPPEEKSNTGPFDA